MSGAPSQNDRVLARLRLGPVAAVEFQPPDVCDGGTPVWRVAARVDVLTERAGVNGVRRRRVAGCRVGRRAGGFGDEPVDGGAVVDASAFETTGGYHDVAA